jgi:hypothetical protein
MNDHGQCTPTVEQVVFISCKHAGVYGRISGCRWTKCRLLYVLSACIRTIQSIYPRGSKSPQSTFPLTVGIPGLVATVGCINPELYPGGGLDCTVDGTGGRDWACEGGMTEICGGRGDGAEGVSDIL